MVEGTHIGIGIYSLAEAEALTNTSARSIRRWLLGYRYKIDERYHAMPAVWHGDIVKVDSQVALSFLDLMEIRFIKAFREHHVSWPAIREAAALACKMFNDGHPFTRGRFRTDGVRIFQQIKEEGEVKLFDMNRQSWVFNEIVSPSLYAGVEFEHDQVARWFPLFPKKSVIIDPKISFGRPTVLRGRVPTEVLAAAATAEGSAVAAARWYNVSPATVTAAVEFEKRLAA